jgi:hypothetical protein
MTASTCQFYTCITAPLVYVQHGSLHNLHHPRHSIVSLLILNTLISLEVVPPHSLDTLTSLMSRALDPCCYFCHLQVATIYSCYSCHLHIVYTMASNYLSTHSSKYWPYLWVNIDNVVAQCTAAYAARVRLIQCDLLLFCHDEIRGSDNGEHHVIEIVMLHIDFHRQCLYHR